MSPRLRALALNDAADVAALVRRAFGALTVAADPRPSALRVTPDDVAAVLARGGGAAFETGAGLAASLLWERHEDALHVSRLAVAPEWRRRGLARGLLAEAERVALASGARRLTLATRLAFADNRRLFATCGFSEGALHTHPGYAAPTFVDLEKPLGGLDALSSSA